MIGLRKTEIVTTWFWYLMTIFMALFVQIQRSAEFYKTFNFWVCIVLNIAAYFAMMVFKENYADKQRIRKYSKWPLDLKDSKYLKLVNCDILMVFVIIVVNVLLYIRIDSTTYRWMLNFSFVIAVVLFFMSYMDKKYGPKEMTRREKLEERRRKRQENQQNKEKVAPQSPPAAQPAAAKPAARKKKKYSTGGKKK